MMTLSEVTMGLGVSEEGLSADVDAIVMWSEAMNILSRPSVNTRRSSDTSYTFYYHLGISMSIALTRSRPSAWVESSGALEILH